MAIKYCLVERSNPQDRTAPKKYYASAVKRGAMDIAGLATRIAGASTASKGDIMLVLTSLGEQLQQLLVEGYSVKVDGLGIFRVTVSGAGAPTQEEFHSNMIRKFNVRFKPEVELIARVNRASLERTASNCIHDDESTEPGVGE